MTLTISRPGPRPAALALPALSSAARLSRLALELARHECWWRPAVRFDDAVRVHTRLPLDGDREAWLLTWLPGQGTAIHDHGGSAGAFVVLAGELVETMPAPARPGSVGRAPAPERTVRAGGVRTFGPAHIHQVGNHGHVPAISLHLYAPRLSTMTRYALDGGHLRVVHVEAAGTDW